MKREGLEKKKGKGRKEGGEGRKGGNKGGRNGRGDEEELRCEGNEKRKNVGVKEMKKGKG
jgi:hypothetical protein